jgi:hypothetical protein
MTTKTHGAPASTARALIRGFLAFGLAALMAACGGGGSDSGAVAPTFTTQPADQSVTEGAAATFSVVAAGTGPLTYQWSSSNIRLNAPATQGLAAAMAI